MTNDVAPHEPKDTSDLLDRTGKKLAAGLAGIAASDRKDLVLSVGHILQRLRGGKFLSTLKSEWDGYKEKGRINDVFEQSEQNYDCLQELLDFIDKDIPDTQRLQAMKNLYLNIAVNHDSMKPDYLPQQFMQVCRSLSSGELIVLLTAYSSTPAEGLTTTSYPAAKTWLKAIVEHSGLPLELVELHEQRLIEKRLLIQRIHGDRSGIFLGEHNRLTALAVDLCQWISKPPE